MPAFSSTSARHALRGLHRLLQQFVGPEPVSHILAQLPAAQDTPLGAEASFGNMTSRRLRMAASEDASTRS